MNTNITNQFAADITNALVALQGLGLKGQRPQAVLDFLSETTDEGRLTVTEEQGGGLLRRGMRQIARRFEAMGDQETADAFWALRDDIDETDDTVFVLDVAV